MNKIPTWRVILLSVAVTTGVVATYSFRAAGVETAEAAPAGKDAGAGSAGSARTDAGARAGSAGSGSAGSAAGSGAGSGSAHHPKK